MMDVHDQDTAVLSGSDGTLDIASHGLKNLETGLDAKTEPGAPAPSSPMAEPKNSSISLSSQITDMNMPLSATSPSKSRQPSRVVLDTPTPLFLEALFTADHLFHHDNVLDACLCTRSCFSEEITRLHSLVYSSTSQPALIKDVVFNTQEEEYEFAPSVKEIKRSN